MLYITENFSSSMLETWRLSRLKSETRVLIQPISKPEEFVKDFIADGGTVILSVSKEVEEYIIKTLNTKVVNHPDLKFKADHSDEILVFTRVLGNPSWAVFSIDCITGPYHWRY